MRLNTRWLMIAVAGIVPAFIAGYLVAQTSTPEQAVEAPVEPTTIEPEQLEPVPVFPNLNLGPRPIGQWKWPDLRGGECIESFDDPFADTFQVVSCAGPHQAEFVRAGVADEDPEARYPGDNHIRQLAEDNCSEWELETLNQPEAFDDLLVTPSYSLGESAWRSGDRLMGCFIYRDGGEEFMAPLVVR